MNTRHRRLPLRAGFTLVEVLIAATISVIAIAGVSALLISGLRYYNVGKDKIQISEDTRRLSLELLTAGRNASDFKIYNNFGSRTVQAATGAGDMVAFLYADTTDEAKVVRVICYYRDQGSTNNATEKDQALRKYDSGVRTAAAYGDGSAWLPSTSSRVQNKPIVSTTADATATQTYMFQGIPFGLNAPCALGVSGQIVYWNKALRRLQNTYNIVVTCRS